MELTNKKVKLRQLTANEGMYITQVDDTLVERFYKKSIWLGIKDTPENYREATEEEKIEYESKNNPIIIE